MLEDYSIDNPLKPVLKYNAFVTPWFEIEAKYYDLEYLNGDPYYSLKSLDGVAVLAFTDDNKIITISQFRPALGFVTRELPAGGINVSETPLEAAKRELLEETAYVSDQWSSLGRGCLMMERYSGHVHGFIAKNAIQMDKHKTSREIISVEPICVDAFKSMVAKGEFIQMGILGYFIRAIWSGELSI